MSPGRKVEIRGTRVLDEVLEFLGQSFYDLLINEGGSSSSKTWSICQALVLEAMRPDKPNRLITVGRATFPALRAGAMKDMNSIISENEDLRAAFSWSATLFTWTCIATGTKIEFRQFDDEQKSRGPRRDILFLNEANEISKDLYSQAAMRTAEKVIIDYNPSFTIHWILDDLHTRERAKVVHSTYLDAYSLLPKRVIQELEDYIPIYEEPDGTIVRDRYCTYEGDGVLIKGDVYHWTVYGLGKRGAPGEAIYPILWDSYDFDDWEVYGLDFGYNHATSLVRLGVREVAQAGEGITELHIDQIIHESYLTTEALKGRLEEKGIGPHDEIFADAARPDIIQELEDAGFWVSPAMKGPGSVFAGIQHMKKYRLCFTSRSTQARAQFSNYKWKKTGAGVVLEEPIKLQDDAPDAARYGATGKYLHPSTWLYLE